MKKALLLAGGYGTRLQPLTNKIPKCLVPICGRPLLDYWLESLSLLGPTEIFINTHYLPEIVTRYLQHSEHKNIQIIHEETLLGTGGTFLSLKDQLRDANEGILVAHADNLCCQNLQDFYMAHQKRPNAAVMTMLLFESSTPRDCGIVQLNDKSIVTSFIEKSPNPNGVLANGAVYIFDPSIYDFLNDKITDISTEIIPLLINRILGFKTSELFMDIGKPEALKIANLEVSLKLFHKNYGASLGLSPTH